MNVTALYLKAASVTAFSFKTPRLSKCVVCCFVSCLLLRCCYNPTHLPGDAFIQLHDVNHVEDTVSVAGVDSATPLTESPERHLGMNPLDRISDSKIGLLFAHATVKHDVTVWYVTGT